MVLFVIFIIFIHFVSIFHASVYNACPVKSDRIETRELYVATCDTRSHWKEFNAMKVWNVSGAELRQQGLSMINVCKGHDWGRYGFLTKPMLYYNYITTLPKKSIRGGDVFVILMDSDTFWSVNDINKIWNRFDCARGTKNLVVSTEMSCWIGRYCTNDDLKVWYNDSSVSPSYSPFLNSGVIMGRIDSVGNMLDYVIRNNASYFITYKKHKFDDQFAIADYAFNINPNEVALDYRQQIAASCSVHYVIDNQEDGWPFVCKGRDGQYHLSCTDRTNAVARHGHFNVNRENCQAHRVLSSSMPGKEELESLSPDPLIWHGNGAGKRSFLHLAHQTFKCQLNRMNMTELQHMNTFGR
mmetsp:Transcript_21846/g.19902  ORF Transcript_21846/g.19902 Transcript_21846/m.19902 type:complete len:355 (-) Transcript_21846:4-1068(-)